MAERPRCESAGVDGAALGLGEREWGDLCSRRPRVGGGETLSADEEGEGKNPKMEFSSAENVGDVGEREEDPGRSTEDEWSRGIAPREERDSDRLGGEEGFRGGGEAFLCR